MKTLVQRWHVRAAIVAASLVVWFWTQSLIGHRPTGPGIGDKIHELTGPLNSWLQTHTRAANALLIASSLVIDSLGIFLIGASIFGKTLRPFVALLLVFAMRQICQWLCALPPPEQMIWHDPGFPSLLVTYGVANDLFFSGHTAIAVLGAIELYRLRPRPLVLVASVSIVLFEATTVLVLRAHYTMDVFTGAVAAIVASNIAGYLCANGGIWKNRARVPSSL
ncbi:MAG TPA: phosphatase PAP2-related protein [Candidatus Acidoferrum sp.]|nr:phosphatase PAP2-related protein [Candidatus Acidoferrum sp.]